jgi:hypothetical protein
MTTAFGQPDNTHDHPFGVLEQQVEPKYGGSRAGTNIPVKLDLGFSQIPGFVQPTDLNPAVVPEKVVKISGQLETSPDTNPAHSIEKLETGTGEFVVPEEIIYEINNLIITGRKKLRVLGFDINESHSFAEIRKYIDAAFAEKLITQPERQKMLGFLKDKAAEPEAPEEPKMESVVVSQEEEITPKSTPEKIQYLKETHGIIVEPAVPERVILKKRILEKVDRFFDKHLGLHATEMVPEDTSASPLQTPAPIPVPVPEEVRVPEKPITGKYVFPFEFYAKKLYLVRGETDGSDDTVIKVFFGNKQIAQGRVASGGQEIEINPEFKSGLTGKETIEERAFKYILPAIKTLRLP